MVIVIDPQIAGISGDMFLSALVDLGANKNKIFDGVNLSTQFLPDSIIKKIDFKKIKKHGIESTELILELNENIHERKGSEIKDAIVNSIKQIELSQQARNFAISCIDTLILSESKIHGVPFDSVHFHEASSIDTLIDIVGIAIALDDLDIFNEDFVCMPIAVGGGFLNFSHGLMSNPASAILEILKNSKLRIIGGKVKDELTTPTGATIIANLSETSLEFYPEMDIEAIGYGAGRKNFENMANVLKIVKGNKKNNFQLEQIKILDTNVDDISGEILGNLIETIMKNGAKDISIFPGITKKGRPTNHISIICDDSSLERIIDLLIFETGTLGVRVTNSNRFTVPRILKNVQLKFEDKEFSVKYKISTYKGKNFFKIENEDLNRISRVLGKSIKETEFIIRNEILSKKNEN